MEISAIVRGVLCEMEAQGYSKKTLLNQTGPIYSRIERWFRESSRGESFSEAVAEYLAEQLRKLDAGQIGRHYYRQLKSAAMRLCEYAETDELKLGSIPGNRIHQPSAEAEALIGMALSANEYADSFRQKSHSILRRFFCYIEGRGLNSHDITRAVMVSFIHHCCGSSANYLAYIIRSLRVLSDYLVSIGVMAFAPDFKFILPKCSPQKIIPAYSEQELSAVLDSIDRSCPTGKRDYAIILLAVGTGLRGGDIANLKLADIDWRAQSIRIVQGKTKKAVYMPISGQICNAISDYILHGRPKADCDNVFLRALAPFISFSRGNALGAILARRCAEVGVEKKPGRHFHSLRRTFGTWLAAEEVQITTIAQMLGHADLSSSKPYLSFNDAQLSLCAMGFDDIPLKGGVYVESR